MRARPAIKMPPVKYALTKLGGGVTSQGTAYPGGLDLTTPSLALQPGALRDGLNYECSQSGGYGRPEGYERFDGRTSPSAGVYTVVQVTAFTNVPTVGQMLTQATSGATGIIIAVYNTGGTCYMALTRVVGAFDYTHNVLVGATPIGTATTPMVSISALLNAQYLALAADSYRSLIGAVPGEGPILGVVGMAFSGVDNVYAFRNAVGGLSAALYKASTSGWTLVPLGFIVEFNTGSVAIPADGATLTQAGVTATVKRVMTRTGTWAGTTAAGGLVITNISGGNFGAGAATLSGGATVNLLGIQTAITLQPDGRYEFDKGNFSGQSTTRRIYGADGVNKSFEFDGETYAPITTGLSPDNPKHISYHKNFLFLSKDSSVIHCGVGTPFMYAVVDGGGEIATGDNVTGMISLPGIQNTATLAIFLQSSTSMLYGFDPTTFNYVSYDTGQGALPYSIQNLFDTFVFDDTGVTTLKATLAFGNFASSSMTKNILPFIIQQRGNLVASSVNRTKGQYRVYFSNGYGLSISMDNQRYLGAGVTLFPNPVSCIDALDTTLGQEKCYFGSSDGLGYVYELDVGTSFDGEDIDGYITLAWDALKSPRILKRFRAASMELQGSAYAEISFGYLLGYGTPLIGQPTPVSYASGFSSIPLWDTFTWDQFYWDGQTLYPTDADMTGTAENVQVVLRWGTNYISAFNVNSLIYHYSMRRGLRV